VFYSLGRKISAFYAMWLGVMKFSWMTPMIAVFCHPSGKIDCCHRLVLTFLCTLLLSLLKYQEALLTVDLLVLHDSLKSLDYNITAVYLP